MEMIGTVLFDMDLKLYAGCTNTLVLSSSVYSRLYGELGYSFTSKLSHSGPYSMNIWYFLDKKLETSYMCNDNQGFLFNSQGQVYELEFDLDKGTFRAFKSI
jgi:hypothetical protein